MILGWQTGDYHGNGQRAALGLQPGGLSPPGLSMEGASPSPWRWYRDVIWGWGQVLESLKLKP
jgi:hypothetical protein